MTAVSPERLKLYIVLETSMLKIPLAEFTEQVTDAGATAIQLRDKGAAGVETVRRGLIIKDCLAAYKTREQRPLFIINDRADIAMACGADGVHLGVKDVPPELIRKSYPALIIGLSCNTREDAEKANLHADYAGVGPAFPTSTKKDLRPVIGLEGLKDIAEYLTIPSVAIGGITSENAADIMKTGVSGPAVSSYICSSPEPGQAVKRLLKAAYEGI